MKQKLKEKEEITIGFIGMGVMGASMCSNLLKAGFKKCTIYNRTASKMNPLIEKGATPAKNPYEVGKNSDVVFTILGFPHDVRNVILGSSSEKGVIDGLEERKTNGVVVDMTTSEPNLAKEIYEYASKKHIHSVDAPVSGGDVGAREARLSIMVGGDKHIVHALNPFFSAMGKNIQHMGPAGAGQHTKMCNQIVICTKMIGVCEGLLYAQRAGLDLNQVLEVVGGGAAGSWSLTNYGPRIVQRNFDPGFFVEHFIKDMEIALREAMNMKLKLPGLELALQLYKNLQELGHGKKGTHSLILALEKMQESQQ